MTFIKEYAQLAVILVGLTSIVLLLHLNWRWTLLALGVQYLATAWLVSLYWPPGLAAIKLVVPNMLQRVVDEAIQLFGAAGLAHDLPLAAFFVQARALRIADGPDAVHRQTLAKLEVAEHQARAASSRFT